jgi:hypothetical protein
VYSLGASPEAKFSPLCSKRESWTGFKIGDVENNVAARGYHDSVHVANVPLSANRLSVYWPANRLAKPSVWKIWGKRFDTDASGGAAKDDLLRRNVRLLLSSYFLNQQRHLDNVELVVELFNLFQVLLLHLSSRIALLTWVVLLREEQLVNDD